jgi:hypothetical protein
MLIRHHLGDPIPPGGVHPGGASAQTGHGGPQELFCGERVLGSTALVGRGGPQELLSGE